MNIAYIGFNSTNDPLDFQKELAGIRSSAGLAPTAIVVEELIDPDLSELGKYLGKDAPEIIHFAGHFSRTKEVDSNVLSENESSDLTVEGLETLLSGLETRPSLLVLSGCESSHMAAQISRLDLADCIIGFPEKVTDYGVGSFFQNFYQEILSGSMSVMEAVNNTKLDYSISVEIYWSPAIQSDFRTTFRIVDSLASGLTENMRFAEYRLVEKLQEDDLSVIWKVASVVGGKTNEPTENILRLFKFPLREESKQEASRCLTFLRDNFAGNPSALTVVDFDLNHETPFVLYDCEPGMQWTTLSSFLKGEVLLQSYPLLHAEKVYYVHRIFKTLTDFYETLHNHTSGFIHGRLNPSGVILLHPVEKSHKSFGSLELVLTDLGLWHLSTPLGFKNRSLAPSIRRNKPPRAEDDITILASLWYWMLSFNGPLPDKFDEVCAWLSNLPEESPIEYAPTERLLRPIHSKSNGTSRTGRINATGFSQGLGNLLSKDIFAQAKAKHEQLVRSTNEQRLQKHRSKIGLDFIKIPDVAYLIGPSERERRKFGEIDEGHQTSIKLKEFHMSETVLSIRQAIKLGELIMESGDAHSEQIRNIGKQLLMLKRESNKDHPFTYIPTDTTNVKLSWQFAKHVCEALSVLERDTGNLYLLPTEAQWEYACRGGGTSFFNNDSDHLTPTEANYYGCKGHLCEVGEFSPNSFGLYQMHGNVWEFCDNLYQAEDYEPTTHRFCESDVPQVLYFFRKDYSISIRGGDYETPMESCRSSARSKIVSDPMKKGKILHRPTADQSAGIRLICFPKHSEVQ